MQNGKKHKRIYLAYIASIIMIIGVNLPQYIVLTTGEKQVAVSRLDNEGILLFISVIAVMMFRFCKRKKYIVAPLVFQSGMMIYYVYLFLTDDKFKMVHIGFILEAIAVLLLLISMFIDVEDKRDGLHDMSTIKIVHVGEQEYVKQIVSRDVGWIVTSFVITSLVVIMKIQINENLKGVVTSSISEIKSQAEEKAKDEEGSLFDYECDRYAIGVKNAYITSENEYEVVYLELRIKNKMNKNIVFNNVFATKAIQNKKPLKEVKGKNNTFNVESVHDVIANGNEVSVYASYVLSAGNSEKLEVSIMEIGEAGGVSIVSKVILLKDMYYIDNIQEVIEVDKKLEKKKKNNSKDKDNKEHEKNENNKEEPKKEQNTDIDGSDTKDNDKKKEDEVSKEDNPSDKQTEVPREETKKPVTESSSEKDSTLQNGEDTTDKDDIEEIKVPDGCIMFKKPSDWNEESIDVYLYYSEEDTEEYSRVSMSKNVNGLCSFFVEDVVETKNVYISFTNGKDIYPKQGKLELTIGKTYGTK